MTDATETDLLYGMAAIAAHLGITRKVAYHLHGKGEIPTFKMGDKVCARRSALARYFAEQEATRDGSR